MEVAIIIFRVIIVESTTNMETISPDHDLLIELRTEMRGMRDDMKGLRDDTKVTITDHESRIRKVEQRTEANTVTIRIWISAVGLLLAIIDVLTRIYIK